MRSWPKQITPCRELRADGTNVTKKKCKSGPAINQVKRRNGSSAFTHARRSIHKHQTQSGKRWERPLSCSELVMTDDDM